jgi:hypothetical protein
MLFTIDAGPPPGYWVDYELVDGGIRFAGAANDGRRTPWTEWHNLRASVPKLRWADLAPDSTG